MAPLFVARWQNHAQLKCKLLLLTALNSLMHELFSLDEETIGEHLLQINIPTRLLAIIECFVGPALEFDHTGAAHGKTLSSLVYYGLYQSIPSYVEVTMNNLAAWTERCPAIQQDLINCRLYEKIVRVFGKQPKPFEQRNLTVFTREMRVAALVLAVAATKNASIDPTHQIAQCEFIEQAAEVFLS